MVSIKELAAAYGCDIRTLKRRLQGVIEFERGMRLLTPAQLEVIFKKLGSPKQ